MTWWHVNMEQAAVAPRPCNAYDGLSTHGILSCTGVVIVSEGHVFLAHIPPVSDQDLFYLPQNERVATRKNYKFLLHRGISKMLGEIQAVRIVSPDSHKERPDAGPAIVLTAVKRIFEKEGINVPKDRFERTRGSSVRVSAKSGYIRCGSDALRSSQYRSTEVRDGRYADGVADESWLVAFIS